MTANTNPYSHRKKPVNVLTRSYLTRAQEHSRSRIVNMFLQKSYQDEDVFAVTTPGLNPYVTFDENETRAIIKKRDKLYTVHDDTVYEVAPDLTKTSLGNVNTDDGIIINTSAQDAIFFYDFTDGYVYSIDGETFNQVTDVDMPTGSATVTSINGYIVLHNEDKFYWAELGTPDDPSGTVWDGNFFSTARIQEDITAVYSFNEKLYVFGDTQVELWEVIGGSDVFATVDGLTIRYGCEAPYSLANGSEAMFLLARGSTGKLCVLSINESYQEKVISDAGLHWQLTQYEKEDKVTDAEGKVVQYAGREFYIITFPSVNKTWQYDIELGIWTELSSRNNARDEKHLARFHAVFNGKNIMSSYDSSTLYDFDEEYYTDDGTTILRRIVFPIISDDQNELSINELLVDVENNIAIESGQGSDPQIALRWIRDGIKGSVRYRAAGKIGQYDVQCMWDLNGAARKWTGELTMSDPINWMINGVYIIPDYGVN